MDTNNQKINTEGYFYPILASSDNDSKEALLRKWDRFDTLAESAKYKLSSKNIADKIKIISNLFKLELEQVDSVSRSIRNYYFGDLRLEDWPSTLAKEAGMELNRAKEISKTIIDKIINDRSYEESYQASHENVPVQLALKKYPELGEQLITSDRITLKNFPGPVRPSIKNWLADYNFVMGFTRERSAIERTNYLFHNINTQKLSVLERGKLSYIISSFDENSPITVNKNSRQVVFPASSRPPMQPATPSRPATQPMMPRQSAPVRPSFQAPPVSKPAASAPSTKPPIKEPLPGPNEKDMNVRFTSPHTLPFEKGSQGQLQPHRIIPFSANSKENAPEEEDKKEDTRSAKNIINLKE